MTSDDGAHAARALPAGSQAAPPSRDLDCPSADLEHRVTAHLVWPWLIICTAVLAAEAALRAPHGSLAGSSSSASGAGGKYSPTLDSMLRAAAAGAKGDVFGGTAGPGARGSRRGSGGVRGCFSAGPPADVPSRP